MMKRFVLMKKVCFIFLIVGLVLVGCAVPITPATVSAPTPEVYKLRFSSSLNPGNMSLVGTQEWCEYIEAHSGGRLKVQLFDSGSLYPSEKALEAVMMGMCEGEQALPNDLVKIMPEFEVLGAPGIMTTAERFAKIADGEIGAKLWESLERKGLKGIALVTVGGYGKCSGGYACKTRFIKVPADFAGLKIRITFNLEGDMISKYGGVPVTMPGGEQFMALKLGTIDGSRCGLSHYPERKLDEAGATYWTSCPIAGGMAYIVMLNKDWFDKLPSDLQVLLVESGKRIIDVGHRQLMENYDKLNYQYAVDHGVLFCELTPEDMAAWKGDVDLIIDKMKAKDTGLKELIEMAEELL